MIIIAVGISGRVIVIYSVADNDVIDKIGTMEVDLEPGVYQISWHHGDGDSILLDVAQARLLWNVQTTYDLWSSADNIPAYKETPDALLSQIFQRLAEINELLNNHGYK